MPHEPRKVDRGALEAALRDAIRALRLDPVAEPELTQTPARAADFLIEACAGLDPAGEGELQTFPHEGGGDLVVVRDLEFHSLCVHHLAPFFGRALVAYVPDRTLIGISGAARLVERYARRPQLQERMTREIADHLERLVRPKGLAVLLEARHLCMEMRGVKKSGLVETRVVRGALADPRFEALLRGSRPGTQGPGA